MRGKLKDLTFNRDGTQCVSLTVQADFRQEFDRLSGQELEITIKRFSRKRSLDANAFCWALCKDIADRMHIKKEEVYRQAIRDVGKYAPLPIKDEAVERFIEIWESRGIGWIAEVMDGSKLPGYKRVFAYYGSSTYTTEEMSRLIDCLVQDAEALGIPIPLGKRDRERLAAEWTA